MTRVSRVLAILAFAFCAKAATLGRVVALEGGATDIVLDEGRSRVYLISSLQSQVQVYSLQKQTFLTPIPTDQTPISAALSRDGNSLYVTCYDGSSLDVIDLNALSVSGQIALPAKPEGVAVAADGRVLTSTTGSGTAGAANVLLLYDPSPKAAHILSSISVTPAAPTPPSLPPPLGRAFLATHSQLSATRDGSVIAGINVAGFNATTGVGSPTVFVYEAASGTVLRSRIVAGSSSNVLAVSDDGTRFMAGPNLFDTATLQVMGQMNLANAPFPVSTATNFNLASTAGGSVFSPDGQTLYAAFDVSPVQNPTGPSVGQLMLSDSDNLLIRIGLQMPENLAGKMVMSADGLTIYALSDSGFVILPVGAAAQSPLAVPGSTTLLLTNDQCGVTAQTSSAALTVNNAGKGRLTATAQLVQTTTTPGAGSAAPAPMVKPGDPGATSPQLVFSYNAAAAARGVGTVTPSDFQLASPEAINVPYRVRVYQNNRDAEARGTIVPLPVGGTTGEAFPDLVYDAGRQRVYIANPGLNRVEVYDIKQQSLLAPIKTGQMPTSLALTPDGVTLYVANSGGESIGIIDPDKIQTVGRVNFPPIPFNSNTALATPSVITASLNGPLVLMSNGTLWSVVGNTAVPRAASRLLGQTTAGAPAPITIPSYLAATPGGEYVLLVVGGTGTTTGTAYLYDANADDWVASHQVFTTTATGYVGPVAAGPKGQYYVVNGTLLNQALVPAGTTTGVPAGPGATRLVSAVTAFGNTRFAIFSPPPVTGANAAAAGAPVVQIMDATTGSPVASANALEGPITQVTGTARTPISGRIMAVDAAGTTAYVVTTSGLSIVPLTPVSASDRPQPSQNGAVNLASYQLPVAANGLVSIFGQNLGANDAYGSSPLPVMLGGTCVTLNNVALPLFATSPAQINAQIPPGLAAGNYPLVVHSVAKHAASASQQLAVSKYGPAVVMDSNGQIALFHADGQVVNRDNPASRDEPLTLYALGLGPTTGGKVVGGAPSPSSPLALTSTVEVFFGNPSYKQAAIIVDWSGLAPGWFGLYQLNLRVPGFHMKGDALPVTLRVGGVSSPTTGPAVPYVAVQ
jgi:uncharacterized protein (TIGR03437 family)